MSQILYSIGHFAGRRPWRVLAAWVLLAATAFLLNASFGGDSDETFRIPGAESQRAADAIEDRFPQETLYTSNIIFHSDEGVTGPATRATITAALGELVDGGHVVAVGNPYDRQASTVSEDGRTLFVTIGYDEQKIGAGEFEDAAAATEAARDAGIQV